MRVTLSSHSTPSQPELPSSSPSTTVPNALPAPLNWDPAWQHRPVLRQSGERGRQPIIAMPDKVREEEREFSRLYWREKADPVPWDDLRRVVTDGFPVKRKLTACDVALFPALSGLVILDCDVKTYARDTGLAGQRSSVRYGDLFVTRYGLNDLVREVEALGHSASELATYTVQTKSGGVHLYYRAHPQIRLRTTGHRQNWRVDVVAHNNNGDRSWVAAPPTAGYDVIRDLPVAELPTWLAEFLRGTVSTWPKPGGQRRRAVSERSWAARVGYERAATAGDRRDYYREWIGWELREVELANEHGGWNDALNHCAWTLFKHAELSYEQAEPLLLRAADPWNDAERRKAVATINSAWDAAHPGNHIYLEA